MNLSMKWLADYVDCKCGIKEFAAGMTMSGSKVERYETEGSEISNVVAAKVLEVVPHPDSDHLVVCQADAGTGSPVQIVTGAPNVRAGDFVPAALHGSTLPGGVTIKKGKLRGVESNGMLCSLSELGLTKNDFPYAVEDGIFILGDDCIRVPGTDIREAIGLNDTTVEFEITSNRPDCFSVVGLAREASATFGVPLKLREPSFKGVKDDINSLLSVKIENTKLCSRYIAGIVKNVKIAQSPRWLRERLRASGVRPINNFVDITNFVMLEYGHPMHAFDLRYVDGSSITVRNAKQGEKITTLDGNERTLSEEMLVIADANKPVAVAGVMGGEYSGIMDDTKSVVFESACFDGASVRLTAKKLGMRTDASARFEKGLDPHSCMPAIIRAFELVEELGCGDVVSGITDCDYSDKTPRTVPFNTEWVNAFLGTEIPESDMIKYLESLGFEINDGMVISPYYRVDILSREDIAEEIARIYGYNNIPGTIINGVAKAKRTREQLFSRTLKNALFAMGINEITTFSFISPKYFDKIRVPENSGLRNTVNITNPLGEDTSVMRTTLLPSVCEILSKNYNFRNPECSVFELGNEYIPAEGKELPDEPLRLCIGMYDVSGAVDFYAIKGIAEGILDKAGVREYEITAAVNGENSIFGEYPAFHPGRTAIIKAGGEEIGIIGELHPQTLENYEIGVRSYAGKLLIPEIMAHADLERSYKPLPKFPATTRDIAIVCDERLPVAELEKAVKTAAGKILESCVLFDVYQGKQVAEGKKSVAYKLTMRSHDGTLTDEQADNAVNKALKALAGIGAELRG